MKKRSKKFYLPLIAGILAIGTVLFTKADTIILGGGTWDVMNFISQEFWGKGPSNQDIVTATFGDYAQGISNTAYITNRTSYSPTDCTGFSITMASSGSIISPKNNEIWILDQGNYTATGDAITGSCIGIIGSGNVNIAGTFNFLGQNIIVDNFSGQQIQVNATGISSSATVNVDILANNLTGGATYRIIGDVQSVVSGTVADNGTTNASVLLSGENGNKRISVIVESGNVFLGHYEKEIILVKTLPSFSAIDLNGQTVISGSKHFTGVKINFVTGGIASATINSLPYNSGTIISSAGGYVFLLTDVLGNTTGISFTIDYSITSFSGVTLDGRVVTSGGAYNTGVIFTFDATNVLSSTIGGASYTGGTTYSTTGLNKVFLITDNSLLTTGIIFSIDMTNPVCTAISPLTGSNVSGNSLNLRWSCSDVGSDNSGLSGITLIINDSGNNLVYSTGLSNTATGFDYNGISNTYQWKVIATDNAGNTSTMSFQNVKYSQNLVVGLQHPGLLSQGKYFLSGNNIIMTITGNLGFSYQFTGDILASSPANYITGTVNKLLILSGSSINQNVIMNYQSGELTGAIGPIVFYVDNTSPTITGNYPTSGLKTKVTTTNFQRTGTDAGAGISGYSVQITKDGGSRTEIYSGGASNYSLANMTDGVYTRKVIATDKVGNTKEGAISTFTIDNSYPVILGVTGNTYYNTDVTPSFAAGTGILNGRAFVSGTPITGEGNYILSVTNSIGNTSTVTFAIDKTNPTIALVSPISGTKMTNTNTVNFIRNGADTNLSGYIFNLYGTYSTGSTTSLGGTTVSNLPNDIYTWEVKAVDKAGNERTATGSFEVALNLTGTITLTGTQTVSGLAYTNTHFGIQIFANKSAATTIVGDLTGSAIVGTVIGGTTGAFSITPSIGDGIKTFVIQVNSGSEAFSKSVSGYLDTTGPTVPSFTGQSTSYSGAFSIAWSTASDAGVGLSGYVYTITSGSTIVKSGSTASTGISIANLEIGSTGNYTIYVASKDKLGNTSSSGSLVFGYFGLEDTSPTSFSLSKEYDVDPDEEIESEKITVSGLSSGTLVLASTEDGELIINGVNVGAVGYVKNGDKVQIMILSSEDYDDITEGTLTIGDKSSIFKVVTISEEEANDESDGNDDIYEITEISSTEKLHVSMIYTSLSSLYEGSKQDDFMLSLKYIVKDKIEKMEDDDEDVENVETMKYLYNLISKDFGGDDTSNSSYTAPNGKKYNITYSSSKGYTATNFVKVKYFDTLTEIKSYINKNNPVSVYSNIEINQSWSASSYKAPNGKVYVFFKTTDGRYGSNNFQTAKLFTDLNVMKKYIADNNK